MNAQKNKVTVKNKQKTIVVAHNTARYLLMHYRHILQELVLNYDKVVCVTPCDGYEGEFAQLGIEHHPINMSQHGMNPFREWLLIKKFYQIYKLYQADHAFNFSIKPCLYGAIAARLAGISKIVCMVTGLGYIFLTQTKLIKALRAGVVFSYQKTLRAQDTLLFQNPDDAALFAKLGISQHCQSVVLPGTGIDLNEFDSPAPQINNSLAEQTLIFLFIGRILKDKGIYELVEACKQIKQQGLVYKCVLLGPIDGNPSGISLSEIEQWQAQGLIEYQGETQNVKPYIEQADVFVLPSYREGLPRSGLEAMAMRRAVITSNAPGCREIVRQHKDQINGIMVDVKNSQQLAHAMQQFIEQPQLCIKMGNVSRAICEEHYSVDEVIKIIMTVLDN